MVSHKCELISGTFKGGATFCNDSHIECPVDREGDMDGNGVVNIGDLLIRTSAWGVCP